MITFSYIHNDSLNYSEDLIKLLNSQWPRSEYSRKISIEKSNDDLPLYLLMKIKNYDDLKTYNDKDELIGCLSISRVLNNEIDSKVSVLLENVLIKPSYRGKGYGKILMNQGHLIMKEKGFKISYLSTNDKKEFYKTFDYIECDPISTSNFKSSENNNKDSSNNDDGGDSMENSEKVSNLLRIFGGNTKSLKKTINNDNDNNNLVWMKLNLN